MIEEALRAQLLANDTILGIVGTVNDIAGTIKVFPEPAPEDPNGFPRIIYRVGDLKPEMNFDGPSGLNKQTVTVMCQTSDDPAILDQLTQAVVTLFNGQMGTWAGVEVLYCDLAGGPRRQEYTAPEWGPDLAIIENEIDLEFTFSDP